MRPKWLDPWLTALRSGDYDQCQGAMKIPYADGTTEFCFTRRHQAYS